MLAPLGFVLASSARHVLAMDLAHGLRHFFLPALDPVVRRAKATSSDNLGSRTTIRNTNMMTSAHGFRPHGNTSAHGVGFTATTSATAGLRRGGRAGRGLTRRRPIT